MTTIDSYDISAADEPELLETLASLASRPWRAEGARVANRSAVFTVSAAAAVKRPRWIVGMSALGH
jgi:hypothetical protein